MARTNGFTGVFFERAQQQRLMKSSPLRRHHNCSESHHVDISHALRVIALSRLWTRANLGNNTFADDMVDVLRHMETCH